MFTLKFRRDLSWRWTRENPVLAPGEPGVESNTGRFKIGDGFTRWTELDYFSAEAPTDASNATLADHVNSDSPHPLYDDGPSFALIYQNAKV